MGMLFNHWQYLSISHKWHHHKISIISNHQCHHQVEVQEEVFQFIIHKLHKAVHHLNQLTTATLTQMLHQLIIQVNLQLITLDNLQLLIQMLRHQDMDNQWDKLFQFINHRLEQI